MAEEPVSTIAQNEPTDAPAETRAPVGPHSMRVLPTVLVLVGVALLVFGWWGTHAAAARFDNGAIPIGASALGGLVIIAGVLVDIMAERKRKKSGK
ncbi:MAG TPA: hypothetical protein VFS20_17920 [Longimicrobium sp.]|nr:hypothetical protein [Longimicrobium sp.]